MINVNKFFFLVLILLGLQLNYAAQNETARIKKLARGADVILTGKVTHKQSAWNQNKTKIYTRTTVQVDEYLKGRANGNSVEITYPGGEVGDVGELYSHMPTFEDNEEVLVFLKKDNKQKSFKVFQGKEGKIKVFSDPETKEKRTGSNVPVKALKAQIKSFINE